MPIIPKFVLAQDETHLLITVTIPYVRVSDAELVVDEHDVSFYCTPYLLKLRFPVPLCDDEERPARAEYDADTDHGTMLLRIPKRAPGVIPDLDLPARFMAPREAFPARSSEGGKPVASAASHEAEGSGGDVEDDTGIASVLRKLSVEPDAVPGPAATPGVDGRHRLTGKPLIQEIEPSEAAGAAAAAVAQRAGPVVPGDVMSVSAHVEREMQDVQEPGSNSVVSAVPTPAAPSMPPFTYGFNRSHSRAFLDLREELLAGGGLLAGPSPDHPLPLEAAQLLKGVLDAAEVEAARAKQGLLGSVLEALHHQSSIGGGDGGSDGGGAGQLSIAPSDTDSIQQARVQRALLRALEEEDKFDASRYVDDTLGGAEDPIYQEAMGVTPWWVVAAAGAATSGGSEANWTWTPQETEELRNLPKRQVTMDGVALFGPGAGARGVQQPGADAPETARALAVLVCLLYGYAYDHRLCGGDPEGNVESGWTTSILSAPLCWVDDAVEVWGATAGAALALRAAGKAGQVNSSEDDALGQPSRSKQPLIQEVEGSEASTNSGGGAASSCGGSAPPQPNLNSLSTLSTAYPSLFGASLISLRRALVYPYLRRWDLALMALQDVAVIMTLGKRAVLRCLLALRRVYAHDDVRYLHNSLWVDQAAAWAQALDSPSSEGDAGAWGPFEVTGGRLGQIVAAWMTAGRSSEDAYFGPGGWDLDGCVGRALAEADEEEDEDEDSSEDDSSEDDTSDSDSDESSSGSESSSRRH